MGDFLFGATGGSRTPDLSVRSRTLYPTELRTHLIINDIYNILFYALCQENAFEI